MNNNDDKVCCDKENKDFRRESFLFMIFIKKLKCLFENQHLNNREKVNHFLTYHTCSFYFLFLYRQPYGSGENTITFTAQNVYAHMYLQTAGDLREGTPAYDASIQRIEAGNFLVLSFILNSN